MGHQSILLTSSSHKATMKRRRPRRMDSSSDRLMAAIFQQETPITEVDQDYLNAAETGDLAAVQRAVTDLNANVNCLDHMGRSGLELALMGEHHVVVEYLLPRSNQQCIEDGLLFAISKDNLKMSELLLDHPLYHNHRFQSNPTDGVYQKNGDSPRLRSTSTPVILAAHKNNFYILQLLIGRGAQITPPHDYFCDCIECANMRVYDSVKYSRSRLNTYRALASAAYISLSADDPILTAFTLSHQLEQLAEIEKEYKSEYRMLSEQCKDYAVELLELCQSTEEIVAILNEDETDTAPISETPPPIGDETALCMDNFSLARVKLALKYEQKRFISHASCQRQLISLWYSGLPWMRHQHMVIKLLAVPTAMLLLPFATLVFLAAPNSKYGKVMRSPFVKFLNHTCAYIVFLILVFMSCFRSGTGNTWLDMACHGMGATQPFSVVFILIFVWILGMFLHECRQLWREGPKDYLTDWWNWMDSSLIMLYLAYYAIALVIYAKVSVLEEGHEKRRFCPPYHAQLSCRVQRCIVDSVERNITWGGSLGFGGSCLDIDKLYSPTGKDDAQNMLSDMSQMADIFFSMANVLSFTRVAHLLPANEQLGPLLVSFGRMLHDVARFGIVFLLVFLAFLCGLTSLYRVHMCENAHFSRVDYTLASLFWATFGMGDTKATTLDNRLLTATPEMVRGHTTHSNITVIVGYVLFCTYIVAAVVVMLNMLIAMMSNSFQEIYDDRDVEWKFARAKLWSDFFEDGCTLPTPFNLIPNPKYLVRLVNCCRKKIQKTRDEPPMHMSYIYTRRKNGLTGDMSNIQLPKKPETLYRRVIRRLVQRLVYKRQSEFNERIAKDNEIEDLKTDICTLTHSVDKLRAEVTQVRTGVTSSTAKQRMPRNGYAASGTTRTRTELHV